MGWVPVENRDKSALARFAYLKFRFAGK